MVSEEDIRAAVEILVREAQPERVILFGSYAYGEPTPDSDVDLMVIMDHSVRNVEKSIEICTSIRRTFPLDLFVRRPADIAHRLELGDSFIREIVERGSVLYEGAYA